MKNRRKLIIIGIGVISLVCCASIVCILALVALNNPVLSSGLKQLASDFGAMIDLQQRVASTYPAEKIQVNIRNGHILAVSLINPEFDSFPHEEQEKNAEDVARFVFQNFSQIDHVDTIQIAFVEHRQVMSFYLDRTHNYVFDTESFR